MTTSDTSLLTPNTLALIALCNEYCAAIEQAASTERPQFIASMLRLLPRIYITATDLQADDSDDYIEPAMDENLYDSLRSDIANMLGADDTYLEVFEDDMKYSDTPIAASIAEGLTDLMQVFYNFIATVKDAPEPLILEAVGALHSDFTSYWSATLCNVLRALNHIRYNSDSE